MNASNVSRTLALIPERVVRQQSGSTFDPAGGRCSHPERIAHLAQFLEWLGPLREVTKDDLRVFGLLTAYGKPSIAHAEDEEGGDTESGEATIRPQPVPAAEDEARLEGLLQ